MKPYYSDDWVTIYHGDCRNILPGLPKADLVITDPPYGINYQSAWRIDKKRWKEKIIGDNEFPLWFFDEIRFSRALFVWCRWDILPKLPIPKSFIVWNKGCHSMGDLEHEYGRQWEACAFYPGENHKFNFRPIDIMEVPRVPPEKLIHPNEKPVHAITPLIHANVGEMILDPFMGSGTTLRAAKDLNRKATGIEIEEKYCEIAAKRMAQEVLDFGLQGRAPESKSGSEQRINQSFANIGRT
jgi:site-specific DNA-methyltransferase (adenine-specific)